MRRAVFDVESDNLLDEATRIHSLVIRDLDSNSVISCTDASPHFTSIADGLAVLSQLDLMVGHNAIKYDIPLIRKLYPTWDYRGTVRDTITLARFLWAHIKEKDYDRLRAGTLDGKLIGSHSLEAWGQRLGSLKGGYTEWCEANGIADPWAEWRPEMQAYCEQDTAVTKTLYEKCLGQQPAPQAVEIEHELAWYLAQQERNGVVFNMGAAVELQAKLAARREELGRELRNEFGSWFVKHGPVMTPKAKRSVTVAGKKHYGVEAGAPYQKIKLVEFSPTSRFHIEKVLKERYGWQPTEYNKDGSAKLDEDTLASLKDIPPAAKIIEYLVIQKRLGALVEGKADKSWMPVATGNGYQGGKLTGCLHIHGSVNQNGAVTHRATHSYPNLAQVPKVGSDYGEECRALYTVPPGWMLLGADASGLELRCLAHYMAKWDGGAYGRIILEGKNDDGTDVHSTNMRALGLSGKTGRDKAKTFIYAWLYGGGPERIGSIVEPTSSPARQKKLGKRLINQFLKNTPALAKLKDAVSVSVVTTKTLKMPDGRKSHIRHAHAALNTLLQGAGAIICKAWIVEFNRRMTARFGPQGWNGQWAAVLWIHDEIQVAVRPEIAEEAMAIAVASIEAMTSLFNWRLPLTGEAKVGSNWKETH